MRTFLFSLLLISIACAEDSQTPVKPPRPPAEEDAPAPAPKKEAASRPPEKNKAEKPAPPKADDLSSKKEFTEDDLKKLWKEKGFTPLKNSRFAVKDFQAESTTLGRTTFIGVMGNVSRDFTTGAEFSVEFYDDKEKLIGTDKFHVMNFEIGTKAFKFLSKVDPARIKKYVIAFEQGF